MLAAKVFNWLISPALSSPTLGPTGEEASALPMLAKTASTGAVLVEFALVVPPVAVGAFKTMKPLVFSAPIGTALWLSTDCRARISAALGPSCAKALLVVAVVAKPPIC